MFKDQHSFEDRIKECTRILQKYPERIPIIVEKLEQKKSKQDDIPNLEKKKFLVPESITFGQFIYIIRTRIKLNPEKAIFIFISNTIPTNTQTIREIYNQYKSDDGFLYCKYSGESTFGSFQI